MDPIQKTENKNYIGLSWEQQRPEDIEAMPSNL